MFNVKKVVAPAIHSIAYWSGLSLRQARRVSGARIIMFHGVGDDAYSADAFDQHLQFIKAHFSVISLASLCDRTQQGKALDGQVALTFDDGLRNNLFCAYPLLKKHRLPATFFVCPGLIENGRWLWNHEARCRLQSLSAAQRASVLEAFNPIRSTEVEAIISWMKGLPMDSRSAVEAAIRNATSELQFSAEEKLRHDLMTWEELKTLDPEWVTVGSHTVSHPILSTLNSAEIGREVGESRKLLEEKLGRVVDQFCYPNGAHNPAVVEEVRRNYRVAVTTDPGFVTASSDLVQLPRIGIAEQPLLSWRLHRPTA